MLKDRLTGVTRLMKRKSLIAAIALAALVSVSAGMTWAYIRISSNAVTNEFASASISSEVVETVSGGVKSSVKIKNTGETSAYIRTAVIANTVDTDGNVTGAAEPGILSAALAGNGWVKSGMYWYYTSPVAPAGLTGELLKSGKTIDLTGIQVTVLAEAIQSSGFTADGTKAVVDAWGVDPSALDN